MLKSKKLSPLQMHGFIKILETPTFQKVAESAIPGPAACCGVGFAYKAHLAKREEQECQSREAQFRRCWLC